MTTMLRRRVEVETMTAKLLVIPADWKFPPKLKRKIQDGGYIIVPEPEVGSIRVIEPLPDLSIGDGNSESLWLVQTLLSLVLTDSYSSLKEKLGKKLIERVQQKVNEAAAVEHSPDVPVQKL